VENMHVAKIFKKRKVKKIKQRVLRISVLLLCKNR